jgi:hypothetical protein
MQRQLQLNKVCELHDHVKQAVRQQQQQQQGGEPGGVLRQLADAAVALLQPGLILASSSGSSSSGGGLQQVVLQQLGAAAAPVQATEWFQPSALTYIQHLDCELFSITPAAAAAGGAGGAAADRTVAEHFKWQLSEVLVMQGNVFEGLNGDGVVTGERIDAVVQSSAQERRVGDSIRSLLWQVMGQVKPASCQWYQHAAQHHQQQQQQRVGEGAAAASAGGVSVSVPESTSAALWSALTRSLASDLLLVPPSIRDMMGNDWAAGVGRLGADAGSSSSNSTAARMLAVQYARAARRRYAQVSVQ